MTRAAQVYMGGTLARHLHPWWRRRLFDLGVRRNHRRLGDHRRVSLLVADPEAMVSAIRRARRKRERRARLAMSTGRVIVLLLSVGAGGLMCALYLRGIAEGSL